MNLHALLIEDSQTAGTKRKRAHLYTAAFLALCATVYIDAFYSPSAGLSNTGTIFLTALAVLCGLLALSCHAGSRVLASAEPSEVQRIRSWRRGRLSELDVHFTPASVPSSEPAAPQQAAPPSLTEEVQRPAAQASVLGHAAPTSLSTDVPAHEPADDEQSASRSTSRPATSRDPWAEALREFKERSQSRKARS